MNKRLSKNKQGSIIITADISKWRVGSRTVSLDLALIGRSLDTSLCTVFTVGYL